MGNTSCKCKKANCEANSRYFILNVDDGSQEARNLHLYPLQVDVNSFLAGNPSKVLSSSSPSPPPPPYHNLNNNNENNENNNRENNDNNENNVNNNNVNNDDNNVDENSEEEKRDEKNKEDNDNSDNEIMPVNENIIDNNKVNIEKKNLTLDVTKEITVEKTISNDININNNNNNNDKNNNNEGGTRGNEKEEEVRRRPVIFQIYHCQSHLTSREEVVHIKVIVTEGNNRGSGHLRYEREGLKGIREMVASAVPHAELGSWYHWQILSPISSVPIPLADLSSETPIRLFNLSDQTYLSYYDDHSNDSFVHFGNQGVPVTFFLKPLHLHFLSSP